MNKFLFHHQWGLILIVCTLILLNPHPSKAQSTQFKAENSFEFDVDIESLRKEFLEVSMEFTFSKSEADFQVELPNPNGDFSVFNVVESPIMDQAGQELYNYKSYKAIDPESGETNGRFSISNNGLTGVFRNQEGLFSISKNEHGKHVAFFDSINNDHHNCSNSEEKTNSNQNQSANKSEFSIGRDIKTFRIALTCTGEYGARAKQLQQSPKILLADHINQVNFIFEKELGLRLQVVTPIQTYNVASTDPFTEFGTLQLISKGRTVIDNLYAGQDYQLGHLITLHGGGRAYIASVCRTLKSGAVSGMSIPSSVNNIRLFAHEIGHQFGAGHSFSGREGYCRSNLFPKSAYEIGSGSTIMSYAGSCYPDNVERERSAFFNAGAQQEIFDLISSKSVCWSSIQTGNTPPTISTSSVKYIPARTPFILKGQASDPDGDALTFSWEQSDLESTADIGVALTQNRTAPLFRVYDPVSDPNRMIPALQYVLNNDNVAPHEILSEISRDLNFKLVVRDVKGGASAKEQLVKVYDTRQAFKVQSFNTSETVTAGQSKLLRWNVANTNYPPISTSTVNIKLSLDGGANFNINLASNVPNDGSHTIVFPNQQSNDARIMIEGNGNIFFDINNAPITITGNGPVSCSITNLQLLNKSGCFDNGTSNTSDDYFTADVRVDFENKPSSGNLYLTGFSNTSKSVFSIGNSSYTFSNLRIPADGRLLNLTAYFSNDSKCRLAKNFGYALSPCSQPDPISDLRMSISSNRLEYKKNDAITIDLTLLNLGNFEEEDIVIKIPMLSGKLAYSSSSASHGNYNLFNDQWVISELAVNKSENLKLQLFALTEGEPLTITAEIIGKGIIKSVTIQPAAVNQLPDLHLTDITNLYTAQTGQLYTAHLKIFNSGNTSVNQQYRVGAYFSKDQNFDSFDPIIGEGIMTYTPLGESHLNLGFYLPPNASAGTNYIIYKVDKNNQITESNENNNLSTSQIQVIGGTPLLKTDLELSSTASLTTLSDGTTTINITVKNNGVGEATDVVIKHHPNSKFSTYLPGSFLMSSGVFNQSTKEWKINNISPGASHTLRFQERIVGLNNIDADFIQIVECNEDDVDSTPNNGNLFNKNPQEDDETAILFRAAVAASSDLKLSITSNVSELIQNENGRVTFYLRNDGPDATSAKVKVNLNEFTYESSSESLGQYNVFSSTWNIPNINSGQTAYLILDVYASNQSTNNDIAVFGEVIESQNVDPDSTPNNGQCCTGREDDEAGKTIRIIRQQCAFNSIISNKTCDDNGTPSDPSDDTFHFSINVQNGNSTGEWEGVIAGIYRRVSYGQRIFVGPIKIQNGQFNFEIEDTDNPSCKTSIVIAPPATCSDETGPTDYCDTETIFPWYEWIAGVQIGSFSNQSGKSKYTYYENRTIRMTAGSLIPVRFTAGFSWYSYDEYWRAWIDFNKNGVFESNEIVFQGITRKGFDGIPTRALFGNIYLGTNLSGNTRMRIAVERGKYPEPCGNLLYGEVEDYPIEFVPNINSRSSGVKSVSQGEQPVQLIISPNPSKGDLFVKSELEIEKIQIIDAKGKLYLEEIDSFEKLDVSELPNGLYLAIFDVINSDEKLIKKFIIQH